MKHWLTGKDPDARKDWRQEEKGPTEVERVGWHHWLDEHEFEQVLGVGDGQGKPIMLQSMGSQSLTQLNNWIKLNILTQLKKYSYYRYMKAKVAQSCLTLSDPMNYTVHGILQARILEWVAFLFSRASSQPRDQTWVSLIASGFFTSWAIKEAP